MDDMTFYSIMAIAMWLFGVIIALLILWAIIRGAVLSALRKHADEQTTMTRRTHTNL